jgi:hypothetical protein
VGSLMGHSSLDKKPLWIMGCLQKQNICQHVFFLFEVPLGKEYIIVSKLSWEV